MPGPHPHAIWIEPMGGGSIITFENYPGYRRSVHRQRRAQVLAQRIATKTWLCRWCLSDLPLWKRTDTVYCRESCRKRASRASKRSTRASISS
jgi:hypothetical protein